MAKELPPEQTRRLCVVRRELLRMKNGILPLAEISRRLAAWAAILAVPTAMAGIYGTNIAEMPELQWKSGYPMVLTFVAARDDVIHGLANKIATAGSRLVAEGMTAKSHAALAKPGTAA